MKIRAAEHIAACARPADFPAQELPEVAFLGRSNVGKSSLLNRLVHRKQLARTSGTPGKTRLIHFYRVELDRLCLRFVDLPGYGFAAVSKRERKSWQKLVESYLDGRSVLRVAVLLQDLRRDVSDQELSLLDWIAERRVDSLVALTKSDKVRPSRRGTRVRAAREALSLPGPRVITTSAETGVGIEELWRAIRERLDGT